MNTCIICDFVFTAITGCRRPLRHWVIGWFSWDVLQKLRYSEYILITETTQPLQFIKYSIHLHGHQYQIIQVIEKTLSMVLLRSIKIQNHWLNQYTIQNHWLNQYKIQNHSLNQYKIQNHWLNQYTIQNQIDSSNTNYSMVI